MGAFVPGTAHTSRQNDAQVAQNVLTPISPDEIRLNHQTRQGTVLTTAYELDHTGLRGFKFQGQGDVTAEGRAGYYTADVMLHYQDGSQVSFDRFPLQLSKSVDSLTSAQLPARESTGPTQSGRSPAYGVAA